MGAYSPGPICPVANIGQNMLVKTQQKYVLYKVSLMEQLPMSSPIVVDFAGLNSGSIAANTSIRSQSLQTPLQMNGNEISQMRMKFLEDLSLQLYEPQSQPRFPIMNAWPQWSAKGQRVDPWDAATEIFVWQDNYPYVDVTNNRDYAITSARVAFYGFRYQIALLNQPNGNPYPYYNTIEEVPTNVPFSAVMAEGFVGYAFQRSGIGSSF